MTAREVGAPEGSQARRAYWKSRQRPGPELSAKSISDRLWRLEACEGLRRGTSGDSADSGRQGSICGPTPDRGRRPVALTAVAPDSSPELLPASPAAGSASTVTHARPADRTRCRRETTQALSERRVRGAFGPEAYRATFERSRAPRTRIATTAFQAAAGDSRRSRAWPEEPARGGGGTIGLVRRSPGWLTFLAPRKTGRGGTSSRR
jgi:hypothetical protein